MSKDRSQPIQVRLPSELLARLRDAASKGGRSLNGEIVARLETSIPREGRDPVDAALVTFITATTERVGGIIGLLDAEYRSAELAKVKGALDMVLELLGSGKNAADEASGRNAGKKIIEYACDALAKPPNNRSVDEAALAEAATVWGLQSKQRQGGKYA